MTPYFFAMDRHNHARWRPIYLADMNQIESKHLTMYREFMSGNHVVCQSSNPFSQVFFYRYHMALEQWIHCRFQIVRVVSSAFLRGLQLNGFRHLMSAKQSQHLWRACTAGAYAGGCALGARVSPPHLGKKVPLRNVQEERKFRQDMSARKNVRVPLRYDKIKTKKVGKKEEKSKWKGLKLKKNKERG